MRGVVTGTAIEQSLSRLGPMAETFDLAVISICHAHYGCGDLRHETELDEGRQVQLTVNLPHI